MTVSWSPECGGAPGRHGLQCGLVAPCARKESTEIICNASMRQHQHKGVAGNPFSGL